MKLAKIKKNVFGYLVKLKHQADPAALWLGINPNSPVKAHASGRNKCQQLPTMLRPFAWA